VVRGEKAEIGVDLMKIPDKPLEVQEGIWEQVSDIPPSPSGLEVKG
jgi:hypothetical protein